MIFQEQVYLKYLCIAIAATVISIAYTKTEQSKLQAAADSEQKALMLTLMRGGLPALQSRCILETQTPEQIKDCVRLGTPTPGREL